MFLDDGADAGIVVADEDGTFSARKGEGRCHRIGGSGGARKHDVEGCSGAKVALRPDGSTVLLDDASADSKAEARAALLPGVGSLDLMEAIEDGIELVGGDAAALVGDLEQDGVGGGLDMDTDG